MKKKILFVINSLGCGGAEKSLVSLLSLFDFSKYDVALQMFNPGGMFMPLLPKEVHVLPQPTYLHYCSCGGWQPRYLYTRVKTSLGLRLKLPCEGAPLHDAQSYWKFAHRAFDALENDYDAAIAWGQGNPTHFVAEKVKSGVKIAVINADYEAVGHNKAFDLTYYERFDHIVMVSDALHEIMCGVYPQMSSKMTTIYDIRNQALMERMAEEYTPFDKTGDAAVLVTVGRMVKQKGYDLAAEAARLLKERGLRFHWYLIGDGPELENVKAYISANDLHDVLLPLGAKDNPYPYMKGADVYVQTSRFEGYCLTLCEARGLGTPVVSTDFDVVYDQLRQGENGLIVAMEPKTIADAILQLLQDTPLREKIARTLKSERVGNEKEIEKWYCLFEGVSNGRS